MEGIQPETTGARTGKLGRPANSTTIRANAARQAKAAIEALAHVAADETAPADARVRAAETLLNHATMRQTA